MHPVLRLYEDVLSSAENVMFTLPPLPRFIFVVHGSATIDGRAVSAGEGWQGEGAVTVKPSGEGVTCWRWELAEGSRGSTTANAPGMMTHEKLTAFLETLPKGDLTFRVRNLTDKLYAYWSGANSNNQVLIGAPRSFEVSYRAAF